MAVIVRSWVPGGEGYDRVWGWHVDRRRGTDRHYTHRSSPGAGIQAFLSVCRLADMRGTRAPAVRRSGADEVDRLSAAAPTGIRVSTSHLDRLRLESSLRRPSSSSAGCSASRPARCALTWPGENRARRHAASRWVRSISGEIAADSGFSFRRCLRDLGGAIARARGYRGTACAFVPVDTAPAPVVRVHPRAVASRRLMALGGSRARQARTGGGAPLTCIPNVSVQLPLARRLQLSNVRSAPRRS
jgi:hypothetical protein